MTCTALLVGDLIHIPSLEITADTFNIFYHWKLSKSYLILYFINVLTVKIGAIYLVQKQIQLGSLRLHHTVKTTDIYFSIGTNNTAINSGWWHSTIRWGSSSHRHCWLLMRCSRGWSRLNRGCCCGSRGGAVNYSTYLINWSNICSCGYFYKTTKSTFYEDLYNVL